MRVINTNMELVVSDRILNALMKARCVVVLTGAGVSAESGVPTFRGKQGLWKKFRPEELATFEAFQKNPSLVWEWYQYRRDLINRIKPNPGHYAMAELATLVNEFHLITQNVDGLHRMAGSSDVIELHGDIKRNRCLKCGKMNYDDEFEQFPPLCLCGGKLRPDVVWFGETLPTEALERAYDVSNRADIFFSVGTSGVVQPAASLPVVAKKHGAFIIEINIEPTELTYYADEFIQGKSGEIMPVLTRKIKELRGL